MRATFCASSIRVAVAVVILLLPASGSAQLWPSTDVLLPWFEVDLEGQRQTTLFSLVNSFPGEVELVATVYSNWGIEVLETRLVLGPGVVVPVNLRDWIVLGRLPDRQLSQAEIEALQAALSGEPSPVDGQYYSTPVEIGLAVGSIRFTGRFPNGLWGDVFIVDPLEDSARGDMLVDLAPTPCRECQTTCTTHGVRFLEGGVFDAGTELIVWSPVQATPQASPHLPDSRLVLAIVECFSEDGTLLGVDEVWLRPLEHFRVANLDLPEHFGWLRVTTEDRSYIGFHVAAAGRYSLTNETTCLPPHEPGIHLEKLTNGVDADLPPGATVSLSSEVEWTYEVTNVGQIPLVDVILTDSVEGIIDCPSDTLEPGEVMICTHFGVAEVCSYSNLATVQARTTSGRQVRDSDPSHYTVPQNGSIFLEKKVNGDPADVPPGPQINTHDPVLWTYEVTNTGDVTLENVTVTDDVLGTVSCPKVTLAPAELMICSVTGEAAPKQQRNVGTVTATTPQPCATTLTATDPAHYYGWWPDVDIEKATNGDDADNPTGPKIPVNGSVNWTYVVTNTGDETLESITVTDDKLGSISCPKTTLVQGESMTCSAQGVAAIGQYRNLAKVVATVVTTAFPGATVSDEDPSHYLGFYEGTPSIDIEKWTNGSDADEAPGVEVVVGAPISWQYVVTNTGSMRLSDVAVVDDQLGAVNCPGTTLNTGASMTCIMRGVASCGLYANLASVSAVGENGSVVTDSDPSHYHGVDFGAVRVEKSTNGEDADLLPGPWIPVGGSVAWQYVVSNSGATVLSSLQVADDELGAICTISTLAVGASTSCSAAGTAIAGQYSNLATVTAATLCEGEVEDSDPSHYFGSDPDIDIEKHTNGYDADEPPGPTIGEHDQVVWTYYVTNTGNVPLSNVTVTDDKIGPVSCPKTTLAPGETMVCQAVKAKGTSLLAKCVYCQYVNIGTAEGTAPDGTVVSDSDPSHHRYDCDHLEGCTPGYWKNHPDSWPATGFSTGQSVQTVFTAASAYPGVGTATLLQALGFYGGPGEEGAARILLRAAVAAVLDAAHSSVHYPYTAAQVIADVNGALSSHDRDVMLALAARLDSANNLGCPLS